MAIGIGIGLPFRRIVDRALPAPTINSLTVISDTEISIDYTSDYSVEIWYSTDNVIFTKHSDSVATPYAITGLTTGTLYYFKARAKNGSKYSAFAAAKAANIDYVVCSGYLSVDSTSVVLLKNNKDRYRSFLFNDSRSRIRQTGSIVKFSLYIKALTNITSFKFQIWRKASSTVYNIIHTVDILSQLVEDSVNTITLESSLAVLENDIIGLEVFGITADTQILGAKSTDAIASSLYYYDHATTPAGSGFNWPTQKTAQIQYVIPCKCYVLNPDIVGIGDSIMAGHPANYSFLESSDIFTLASQIMYQLKSLNTYLRYQNLGIGGEETSEVLARIGTDLIPLKPTKAVVLCGVNDLASSRTSESIVTNLSDIIDLLNNNYIEPIIIQILPWTNGTTAQMQKRDIVKAAMVDLQSTKSFVLVDCDSIVGINRVDGDNNNLWDINPLYDVDGVHYNTSGLTKIAETIYSLI